MDLEFINEMGELDEKLVLMKKIYALGKRDGKVEFIKDQAENGWFIYDADGDFDDDAYKEKRQWAKCYLKEADKELAIADKRIDADFELAKRCKELNLV